MQLKDDVARFKLPQTIFVHFSERLVRLAVSPDRILIRPSTLILPLSLLNFCQEMQANKPDVAQLELDPYKILHNLNQLMVYCEFCICVELLFQMYLMLVFFQILFKQTYHFMLIFFIKYSGPSMASGYNILSIQWSFLGHCILKPDSARVSGQ